MNRLILGEGVLDASRVSYDLLVSALGFEQRATAVASLIQDRSVRKIALGFNHNQVHSYGQNDEWYRAHGFEVYTDLSEEEFSSAFLTSLQKVLATGVQCIRMAVDVSCLDRRRLASVVHALRNFSSAPLLVDFHYAIASFVPPSPVYGRNEIAGPVHRAFAGRFLDPGKPLALVAGLGYEIGKVVGAAEYLQAARVIAFTPRSAVREYEPEVVRANSILLDDLREDDLISYELEEPGRIIATLDAVLRGVTASYNVVLLPGGPKIFALCCLLAHCFHHDVSVWRVSGGSTLVARDVKASGNFVRLRTHWTV